MPSWEEYWGKGGINDQKVASGAGDGIGSNGQALSNSSSYTSTAPSYSTSSTPAYSAPATSYTGSSSVIGNVSGSNDLYKSYQDIFNSNRQGDTQFKQLNTWADKNGSVYDTTSMTPQQIFALSLFKDNNPKADAILKGMGLDMNGNPTGPAYDPSKYTIPGVQNSQQSTSGGSQTESATYKQPMQQGTMVPLSSNPADYAQGGKYYQAPTYNVNSAEFQNKTDEEKKAIFQSNPSVAAQEIQRAKDVWANKAGDPEAQRLAHQWADQVRTWANLPADGSGDTQVNNGGGNPVGTDTGTTKPPVKDPNAIDPTDPNSIIKTIFDMMKQTQGAGMNPNDPYWAQQKANSDLEQQGIFNSKISQYQNLLNSLKSGQGNDLKAITDGVDSATNKIEDNSFQKWLEARQNAASRGLAGSGIASDANTRLLLSRQRDMADMFTQKNTAMNDVNKRYGDQINTAQSGIANTNLNAMQSAAFQKLFKDGQDNLTNQGKSFADLFGVLSKQNMKNQSDETKYALEKYKTDANTKYLYDKMDADMQNKTAQLQLDWTKYGLDVTKVFGQDENGNPTLDARKMVAQISQKAQQMAITQAHNAVTENQGWARINQSDQDMQIKLQAMTNQTSQFATRMKLDSSNAKDAHLGKQVDAIKSIMTEEGGNLRSLRTQLTNPNLKDDAQKAALQAEYAKSMAKIEAAQNSMGEIYKFQTGDNTASYSGDAPQPFNMNDLNYGDSADSIG